MVRVFTLVFVAALAACKTGPAGEPPDLVPTDADEARHLPLEGALNARDFGGLPGARGPIKANRFVRTGELSKANEHDKALLLAHDVKVDLDLRAPDERKRAPDSLASDPRFRYEGISLLGEKPIDKARETLGEFYVRVLYENQAQFKRVFEVIAAEEKGAVLFHCSSGKDRTGMVSAMLLALGGVDRETILHDYAISAHYLAAKSEAVKKKRPQIAHLLGSPPEELGHFLDALDQTFGGTATYLKTIGVSERDIATLSARLGP